MKKEVEFDPASAEAAKKRALWLLDKRDYSRAELIGKLTEKGYEETAAESAVDRLAELGFVDDARYAPIVVRHYAAKGYGARRVRQELQRRGKTGELRRLAESEDGARLAAMLDQRALERAAASGDGEALRGILGTVLRTEEGRRLAEGIRKMMES